MKILDLQFSNFKSFGNYQNPVTSKLEDLRNMNMIFGENNSGKSNVLKFIDLLFQRKVERESVYVEEEGRNRERKEIGSFWKGNITDQPFIFHKNHREFPIVFNVTIEISDAEITASGLAESELLLAGHPGNAGFSKIELNGEIVNSGSPSSSSIIMNEVKFNGQTIYVNGTPKVYFAGNAALRDNQQAFESLMGVLNDSVFFLDTDRAFSEELATKEVKTLDAKSFKNWLHNLSLDLVDYKKYEDFVGFVKEQSFSGKIFRAFDPSFAREMGDEIEIMLNNGSERLPITSYGTGVQQILLILAMLFETKAKIILIEELELNLSPKTQRELFKILRALITKGVIHQVIFTTHSSYFNFRTDLQLFEVSISGTGVSSVKSQSDNRAFFKSQRLD